MRIFQAAAACILTTAMLPAQTLTPREVFYGDDTPAAVKPVEPKVAPKVEPKVDPKKLKSEIKLKPESKPEPKPWSEKPAAVAGKIASARPPVIRNVSDSSRPLGLRYSVMKLGSSGEFAEVNPETTFVSGDSIRLTVESNDAGYLYVVMQGSSGIWRVLYPSAETGGGGNQIEKGHIYNVPPSAAFTFDEKSGSEKLFVVLSRQPEKNVENLIYSLREKASSTDPTQDDAVQRLRDTYSRDLLIEKVDEDAPPAANSKGPKKETAVYVVNPKSGTNASVVADIQLRHK